MSWELEEVDLNLQQSSNTEYIFPDHSNNKPICNFNASYNEKITAVTKKMSTKTSLVSVLKWEN